MNRVLLMATSALVIIGLLVVPACNGVDDPDPTDFTLTMAVDPAGSGTTSPSIGTSERAEGAVIPIVATPAAGSDFVFDRWEATAGDIDDVNSASAEFTMPAGPATVTAYFVAPDNVVKVMIAGDMSFAHGTHMMLGAQQAVDEIGEFVVGDETYIFELVEVVTYDLDPGRVADTKLAVEDKIEEVDLVMGGFRTEHSLVIQEVVCKDNEKILLGLGTGGVELNMRVQASPDDYDYFFRLLPINDYFLVTSAAKILQSVILTLLADEDFPFDDPSDINVYIVGEDAVWVDPAVDLAETQLLPALGVNHVGTARPADNAAAGELAPTVAAIAAADTHVVFTIMAGTVGMGWAGAVAGAELPVISAGINAIAHLSEFGALPGGAGLHHITLDMSAEGVVLSPETVPFMTKWLDEHGIYPMYTGLSAYDGIRLLKAAIEDTGGDLSSDAISEAIRGIQMDAVGGRIVHYPYPSIDLGHIQPGLRALGPDQAFELHGEHLLDFYDEPDFASLAANWGDYAADWTSPPHLPQDLAYGPAVGNMAIASQWVAGTNGNRKVAVWPREHFPVGTPIPTLKAVGLFDKWGNWNFQWDGTEDITIPPSFYDQWGI